MPYVPLREVLPDLAAEETRSLRFMDPDPRSPLAGAWFTLEEMYCNEDGCDCRRVFLHVWTSGRPGPEAVIAWGWEPRAYYVEWMGDDDPLIIDSVVGPALNLSSPQTELAQPLLEQVKEMLSKDAAYTARIQEHYRLFREQIEARHPAAQGAAGGSAPGRSRRVVSRTLDLITNPEADVDAGRSIVEVLIEAGLEVDAENNRPWISMDVDEDGALVPPGEEVFATDGEVIVAVRLPPIPDLFTGDRRPPSFADAPPPGYMPFFLAIDRVVYDWCSETGDVIRDKDLERVYNDVRRRPRGKGQHPVVPYVQAAIRLYMSIHDSSEHEFEAVLRRLCQSARTFAMGYTSRNYYDCALVPLFGDEE